MQKNILLPKTDNIFLQVNIPYIKNALSKYIVRLFLSCYFYKISKNTKKDTKNSYRAQTSVIFLIF